MMPQTRTLVGSYRYGRAILVVDWDMLGYLKGRAIRGRRETSFKGLSRLWLAKRVRDGRAQPFVAAPKQKCAGCGHLSAPLTWDGYCAACAAPLDPPPPKTPEQFVCDACGEERNECSPLRVKNARYREIDIICAECAAEIDEADYRDDVSRIR